MKTKHSPGRFAALALALVLLFTPIQVFAAPESIVPGQAVEATISAGTTNEYTIELAQNTRTVLNVDFYDVPEEGSGISYVFSNASESVTESVPVPEDRTYSHTFLLPAGVTTFSVTGSGPALTYIFSFDEADCDTLGHELILIGAVTPTCTAPGYSGDKSCAYCDFTEKGTQLPITDHNFTLINDTAPTCTTSGYTGDTVCTGCDYLRPGEKLAILEHEWTTWTTVIYPTYTREGRSQRNCTMCDLTEEQSIPMLLQANPFTDIEEDAFYYNAVLWAARNGITSGRTDTTFVPGDLCKRSEVVTFLWRTFTKEESSKGENPFKDVSKDAFYYNSVLWAVKNQITLGTSENTFSPDASCTRAQVVTFLWRASGEPTPAASSNFTDISAGQWYSSAVYWAAQTGITQGTNKDGTLFSPNATCTRAEIVTFLHRWIATEELS